ncbi:cilia- and flagella-associated protein 65-like isoform X1 [Haliotis cracherodii]|uniref:cilia- and flagella-associated protein 65-like isoform X1 n=1 Tax=Haliotis cracherodii TaxID=6455 RepID=UPI0039E8FC95
MPTAEVAQQMTPSTYGNIGKVKTDLLPTGVAPTGRVNKNGLEVTEQLLWQGWEPGREYTKNIVLKNVQIKTQKLRYKVPSSRFFSTVYPKPIVLSAGTSFTLPITFRPLEKKQYEDQIQFRTKDGDFDIRIKAILPQTVVNSPERLDFDMCASKDFVHMTFDVVNTGDVETSIQWEVKEPFVIEPTEANLPVRSSCQFKVTFKPEGATVYEAEALCKYGVDGTLSKVTKLRGIGKYPHLLVSSPGKPASNLNRDNLEAAVHFGKTPVGSGITKWVELHNLSPVRAPFRVEHPTGVSRIDTVFHCPQKMGIVPPMASVRIPLMFSPNTVDTTSIDYFNIAAIGNISKSIVKCIGSSKGPTVQLSSSIINFMEVDVDQTGTRTVDIVNSSDVEAVYQFMIDCDESVFKFQYMSGVLKPNSQQTVILQFTPSHPINYYRRVTCLIHNQGPLFLDILGTCHSEMVKPAVLLKKHLDRFKMHVERGFSMYSPEQLNELLREGKLETDEEGAIRIAQRTRVTLLLPDMTEPVEMKENEALTPSIPPTEEYFNDGFHCDLVNFVPHVSTDVNLADFGNCQNLRVIEDKTVNVTNHTKGKVTVQWMGDGSHMFSVYPTVMDIPPLKSCSFRVSFKPNAPNQLYGAELECFVFYKSLRDYRLVEDVTHCPPWCLTVSCTGHTFMPNNETFLPRYDVNSPKLVFPAVNAKESTYRTLCVRNTGTTPILFDVEKDPSSTFAIKPAKGLLKEGVQIFLVKCKPAEVKTYHHAMVLRLNDNDKYSRALQLCGSAEAAEVLMDSDGVMFFKPTCVGTASKRTYSIKNVSRIPLRFEWKLNNADSKLLKVQPDCGIIHPNESQSQTWSFIPGGEEKYVMKPSLIVWGQGFTNNSSGGKKKQFKLRAVGEGSLGEIMAEEKYFDFSDIVVGSSASHHITLYNNSSCSLHYRLLLDQHVDGPYADNIIRSDNIGLDLETMEGVLPARSRQTILLTVRPLRRVTYQYTVSYQLLTPEGTVAHASVQEPQHLCHILVTGVFPIMAVTDARCYGSAIGISKKQLWNLFSLDNMNVCLDSDPSAEELMYNVSTRHSHRRRPPVYTRAILDFNFSAAPLDSEPCVVNLMFENTGTVPTDWSFLFPSDLHLELEYWAETGEFDEDELHQMKVMDNKLFSIEPKRGRMAPGDTQTVTFTYNHTMSGTDRLPVLLKLSKGREILLNFIGVTVEPERRYIHFPSNKHLFTPVPVGEQNSPKQVYELYNGGAVPVRYEFDLTPLDLIRQENFDQPIFECLNPIGEIPPGRSVALEWRFSPLEAKTYMIDVPVHVHHGDTAIITFTGVGFDKRVMGDTMPITDQHDLTGVPSVQSVAIPGQLVYLSRERVSFNNMPLFSLARQMVFVINRSQQRPVSYEWHVTSQADSKCLSISPVRGQLEPGGIGMCRVTFLAAGVPSFYDLDLVCEVTDEYEMEEYKKSLVDWEAEKERQKQEFVITENDLNADLRLADDVEVVERPSSRLQSLDDYRSTPSPDGELTRYRTLPPIKQKSSDEVKAEERRRKRKEKELWEKPTPPRPFLLHLGLTARTHDVQEFQENFPDDYRKYYIDRSLSEKLGKAVERKQEQMAAITNTIHCNQAEANIISGVLCNVLRGLLDDAYFHEAVRKVAKEEIPYFRQFGQRPKTAPPSAKESERQVGSRHSSARGTPARETSSREGGSPASLVSVEDGARGTPNSVESRMSSVSLHSQKGSVTAGSVPSSVRSAAPSQHPSRTDSRRAAQLEKQTHQKQTIKKTSEFGNSLESVLENTLLNIMTEAFSGEFNITARPRFIALPKRPSSVGSRTGRL